MREQARVYVTHSFIHSRNTKYPRVLHTLQGGSVIKSLRHSPTLEGLSYSLLWLSLLSLTSQNPHFISFISSQQLSSLPHPTCLSHLFFSQSFPQFTVIAILTVSDSSNFYSETLKLLALSCSLHISFNVLNMKTFVLIDIGRLRLRGRNPPKVTIPGGYLGFDGSFPHLTGYLPVSLSIPIPASFF